MTKTAVHFPLMGDDEPTQAAEPGVTAPAPCETETQSIYAWSQAGDEDTALAELPLRRSWKLPIAVAAIAIGITAAISVKTWPHHSAPASPAASAPQIAAPTAQPPQKIWQPSPPAQELNPDQRFVAMLKDQGWVFSVPDPQVAQEGHVVCRDIAGGRSFDQEVDAIANGSGIERSHAIRFATTATDILCPQYSQQN